MGVNTTVNPDCHQYFSALSVTETQEQKNLIAYIKQTAAPLMQIDPLQGQFLAFLTRAIQAKTILEIGSFVGYSTLWFAHALPNDGKLISCDINPTWAERAKSAFIAEQVDHKIEQLIQPALTTLNQWQTLPTAEQPRFDLIFIDADKANYPNYFSHCLSFLSANGLIIFDNVWWYGKVNDHTQQQHNTKILRAFNQSITKDHKVYTSFLPIGDGLLLVKLKPNR